VPGSFSTAYLANVVNQRDAEDGRAGVAEELLHRAGSRLLAMLQVEQHE